MSSKVEEVATSPRTVDEARDAVERSRQRISSTLDALEDRIVEKKHEIQDRVDVLRPVREQVQQRPFTAVAVAVGVGALLGSLGGRDDKAEKNSRPEPHTPSDEDRAELREWRHMRRERLQARASRAVSSRHDTDEDSSSRLDAVKHQLVGAVTSAISTALAAKVREVVGVSGGRGDRR